MVRPSNNIFRYLKWQKPLVKKKKKKNKKNFNTKNFNSTLNLFTTKIATESKRNELIRCCMYKCHSRQLMNDRREKGREFIKKWKRSSKKNTKIIDGVSKRKKSKILVIKVENGTVEPLKKTRKVRGSG